MQMTKPDWMSESDRKAFVMLLDLWRAYMSDGDHSGRYRSKDGILQSEGAKDSEQLYSAADYILQLAVDACIDGLAPHERCRIYETNGQSKAVRFPRLDPVRTLFEAEQNLLAAFKRNSGTRIKF